MKELGAWIQAAARKESGAWIQAAARKESGAWIHAFPISSLGLHIDDEVIRVAIDLWLGTPLCHPHICYQCGSQVDQLGTHGLSC